MSIYRKIPERCRKIKVKIPISLRPWAYNRHQCRGSRFKRSFECVFSAKPICSDRGCNFGKIKILGTYKTIKQPLCYNVYI